jgi:hypothetical protein
MMSAHIVWLLLALWGGGIFFGIGALLVALTREGKNFSAPAASHTLSEKHP